MTTTKRLSQAAERVNPVDAVHIWRSPDHSAVDMLIVTHLSVYSTIHEHATAALPNETGGFMLGRVAHDDRDGCWLIEIEEAIPVQPESQNPVHFTFTWRDVDRVRSYREGHSKALIGWYHTHPQLGIFLSETDIERTHRVLFSEPFQVALVFDPVGGRAGYFFWEGAQTLDAGQAAWREFEIAVAAPQEPERIAPPPPDPAPVAAPRAIVEAPPAVAAPRAIVEAPPDPDVTAVGSAAAAEPPTSDVRERMEAAASAPPAGLRASSRLMWTVLASIFFLITGLAVGYFWFGPGRGLP